MVNKTFKDLLIITISAVTLTMLIWLPHILGINFYGLNFANGFATIYRNYDGLEYIVIAKSMYNPNQISAIAFTMTPTYYASHFPGYSMLILLFSSILGFLKSMLFVSVFSTILSAISFYFLVRDFKLSEKPLLLSLIFLILPARWLIVHSIGSAEPTFILFTLVSIYFFMKADATIVGSGTKQSKFWFYILVSAIAGLNAQLTRPPGILLFISFILYGCFRFYCNTHKPFLAKLKTHLKFFPIIIIPLGLLFIFYLYANTYGDFFAYFHSGDNIHLTFPPFQVFNKSQFWVGEIWLEDIIYILILGFLSGIYLWKEKLYLMALYVFVYLGATTLVAHRDISRYALPIFPFTLIAFQKILTSKEFKIVLIIVALAIYLYSQNFILNNTAPIPNVEIFN